MIIHFSAWANLISDLVNKLESDSNIAIEWFKMNKMIVHPNIFQAIALNKKLRPHKYKLSS